MHVEPLHAVTYFSPECARTFEDAGLRGFWRGYFAGRAAPLGAVTAAPVIALFYGFAPAMVERALPAVWSLADPGTVLEARRRGAVAALSALLPVVRAGSEAAGTSGPDDDELAEASALARRAVESADVGGRALGAANAALPWPREPLPTLFHAATALRELRGDGHVAALLTAGLSGLDALVLRAGTDLPRDWLQKARGWTDDAWDRAVDGLRERGLVDDAARTTQAGAELLRDVETVTDHLAAQPWNAIGAAASARFAELVRPLARAARESLPALNPIGLPPASAIA
jgi:hypothetical protein